MLTLQRASAGSGKTYTLTKKFIRLLISISENGKPPRLRTDAELADSVSHILAITFTNKATAEMKERILSRLNDLAYHVDPLHPGRTTYLPEFMEEFQASAEEISRLCLIALRRILYSYSDFNVRTIDTFFQSILRTFTYEADLPESYELIIDNDYIARMAVSSLINAFTDRTLPHESAEWLKQLVRKKFNGKLSNWNVFSQKEKRGGTKSKNTNVFGDLINISKSTESESGKDVWSEIEKFYASHESLLKEMEAIDSYYFNIQAGPFAKVREIAREIVAELERISPIPWTEVTTSSPKLASVLPDILSENADPSKYVEFKSKEWTASNIFIGKIKRENGPEIRKELVADSASCVVLLTRFNEAHEEWKATFTDDFFLWTKYKEGLHRIALLHELRSRTDNIVLNNGALKLSDTNEILRRIIADDDVPFIYERYGTRLNHYLIDEFQDTSRMQWENILPLLRESESRHNENLIIGDAKQSIYRFRNADPTIITERVPAAFAERDERGYSIQENANRRSNQRIVEFNNLIFRSLTSELGEEMSRLYGNTVQLPANSNAEGYTEVTFYDKKELAEPNEEEEGKDNSKVPNAIIRRIGKKITSLLKRGYQQREIAILVDTNNVGVSVIQQLMAYNRTLPPGEERLEFVSEESLHLSASEAVNSVVGCLRMIQHGMEGRLAQEMAEEAGESADTRINWNDVSGHFRYYSIQHPGMPLQERLRNFFSGDFEADIIDMILDEMQAVTLPSLVEALTEAFVPLDLRREDAVFLAAFQDAVLDYCEIYPSDIGSLLRWWDQSGRNASINSPEGTNAISIMTIHKSKGLEFECVFLPSINLEFKLKGEWTWVEVPESFPMAKHLPKMVQVEMASDSSKMDFPKRSWNDTIYADSFHEIENFSIADSLNKVYVAFTRPISELYVYLPLKKNPSKGELSQLIRTTLENAEERIASLPEEEKMMVVDSTLIGHHDNLEDEHLEIFSYGKLSKNVGEGVMKRRGSKQSTAEKRPLTDYFVNSDRPLLQYHEESIPHFVVAGDDDREDPRSEGSLLHAVLERVEVEKDLPRAFERLRVRGLISRSDIPAYTKKLTEALESARERRWFDGTYRILAERPILKKGTIKHRPDRVMLAPDGSAIVVDYKFGKSEDNVEHIKQVKNYIHRLKRALGGKPVKGYLWYINEGHIEEVRS